MLVSHRYRFIFLKTNKTAGTSVEKYFEPYCMAQDEPNHQSRDASEAYVSESGIIGSRGGRSGYKRFRNLMTIMSGQKSPNLWWNHMPASAIVESFGDSLWRKYFRFTTIRNPYEKAVSAYFFQKRRRKVVMQDFEAERLLFLDWLKKGRLPQDRNKYVLDGEYCLTDVIRVETLLPDLERICTQLGIPYEPERLGRKKGNIRPSWASVHAMYTTEARSIVRQHYSYELNKFGYKFPGNEYPPPKL